MGKFVAHEPCPKCGSSNANARYEDGSTYCWACLGYGKSDDEQQASTTTRRQVEDKRDFIKGEHHALAERRISLETCEKWGYQVGKFEGKPCHIANYKNDVGKLVAQKIRLPGKNFRFPGGKDAPLYGQWLWRSGGKMITITEGEIDALSMSQAMDNKWPVVSLPNGANAAAQAVGKALEWLAKFETIVLCFDMDKPGREAVEACAKVLPPGKVKVMNLPRKDANDTLVKLGPQALVTAFWNARDWRPDGIVAGEEITVEALMAAVAVGYELPYPRLQEMVMGLRKREITLLASGTGQGKSTWARELAYLLATKHGCKIGNVFLEESNTKTAQAYIAIKNNIPLKDLRANPGILSADAWKQGLAEVVHNRMWFYDHFGSLQSEQLMLKLRYLAAVVGVDFIILDHISIVVSGINSVQGERKDIDMLMTSLRSLAEETGVGIIAIVHLNQPEGKPHEEGGRVTLRNLRGSGGLKQLSDNVFAMERDQQGANPTASLLRVLKCRETGETGEADWLNYCKQTGRLILGNAPPSDDPPFDEGEVRMLGEIPF